MLEPFLNGVDIVVLCAVPARKTKLVMADYVGMAAETASPEYGCSACPPCRKIRLSAVPAPEKASLGSSLFNYRGNRPLAQCLVCKAYHRTLEEKLQCEVEVLKKRLARLETVCKTLD